MLGKARLSLFASLAALAAAQACGPSVSTIYEGNIRFEHCYRLDLDPQIAQSHRKACWSEWSNRYTYGQTRDRLEYARRRIGQLDGGGSTTTQLDLTRSDAGSAGQEAPAPTSVHAPPPPLAAAPPASATPSAAPSAKPPGPAPPHDECTKDCRESWRICKDECDPDSSSRRTSCKSCDKDYGRCVQRCFK